MSDEYSGSIAPAGALKGVINTAFGKDGAPGAEGKSAYQVAVDNGFKGTEAEWLESLKCKMETGSVSPELLDRAYWQMEARNPIIGFDYFDNLINENSSDSTVYRVEFSQLSPVKSIVGEGSFMAVVRGDKSGLFLFNITNGDWWIYEKGSKTITPCKVSLNMCNEEILSGITTVLLSPDEKAKEYSNLLLNVGDNTIFIAHPAYWNDVPSSETGVFVNRHYSANYDIQLYVELTSGNFYTRIVDSASSGEASVYRDWISVETHVADVIKMNIKQKNLSDECNRLLANIKDNYILSASSSNWDDMPITAGCVFINWRYGTNYNLQLAFVQATGVMWRRIVNRNTGAIYNDWKQPDGTPLLKVLALGDSICRGVRNSEKGFVGDLGFPYKNIGVSSASISNVVTTVTNIPDQLVNEATGEDAYNPDIIIAEGGINDWSKGAELGTMSAVPVSTDEEAEALDRSTVIGGLEYLFYKMITLYPKAQRFFLITHKTWKTNVSSYCPTTANSAGWTQQGLHDAIVKCCKVYNVKVIDVYNDSMINSLFSQYRSAVAYNDDNSVTNSEYVDYDGVHPLAYGYKEGYVPIIRKAIGIGTVK